MILEIFLLFILISTIYYWQLWMLKSKSGDSWMPFHFPLIGCAHVFLGKTLFHGIRTLFSNKKKRIIMNIAFKSWYMTKEPNEVRKILNCCLTKATPYNLLNILFGEALLLAPVTKWKGNRKCLAKCFNQTLLDTFVPNYYEKSNILIDLLKDEQNLNIFHIMQRLTFDSFCATTIGVDLNLQKSDEFKFIEFTNTAQKLILDRFVQPWNFLDFLYLMTPKGKEFNNVNQHIRNIICGIIKEKKKIGYGNSSKLKTVMDCLLELEEEGHFDEEHLINEVLLMIAAATDTSAATMSFTCGLLGMHQDIQQRVFEEVLEVVGLDRSITAEDLSKLKYTERVINETMRIFPVTPLFGRKTSGKLDLGDIILENNTELVIFSLALHRDESIYPNPLKFDPDRFLPEEVAKRPPGSFIPFSTGPRNCIGLRYAYLVMKTTIANIVRNFKINTEQKSVKEIKLESNLVMTSPNLKCTFSLRNK